MKKSYTEAELLKKDIFRIKSYSESVKIWKATHRERCRELNRKSYWKVGRAKKLKNPELRSLAGYGPL